MNKLAQIALVMTLVSCGEDVGSNRKGGSPARSTPTTTTSGATAESLNAKPMSGMARSRATIQLSTAQEITRINGNNLPTSYRAVPDVLTDDEGSEKNTVSRTTLGRPKIECGTSASMSNIDSRIADCLLKNPEKSNWVGLNNGSSTEGDWRLVSLSANGKEVWLDDRTGLVWSDMIASANWCKAAGNNEQLQINCAIVGENLNFCDAQTAEMNLNIRWRLPTRNDFLQADLDGARLVLKSGSFWTATLDSKSATREKAWIYQQDQGLLSSDTLTTLHEVRCVGAPTRQ